MVTLRKATEKDLPAMYELGKKRFGLMGDATFNVDGMTYLWDVVQQGVGFVLVAMDEEKMAGAIGVLVTKRPFTRLKQASALALFVDPAYRGAGVGEAMLDACEKAARILKADIFTVTALSNDPDGNATGLYERMGYSPKEVQYEKVL